MSALPKIVYDAGAGAVTLQFKWGPQNFLPAWAPVVHDNVATSGAARERVVESMPILISFDMGHLVVDDTAEGWAALMAWALPGGGFKFYPCADLAEYYNCVLQSTDWGAKRNAPKKYAFSVAFLVLEDGQAPATPVQVLRRFYGLNP